MNPDTLTPIAIVLVVTLSVAGFVLWQRQTREGRKKRWSIFALLSISAIFIVVLTLLEREFGANSIFFACVVAFVPLGWMAFVNEVVELSVPERFRTLRPWELSGIQYRALGVPVFGASVGERHRRWPPVARIRGSRGASSVAHVNLSCHPRIENMSAQKKPASAGFFCCR